MNYESILGLKEVIIGHPSGSIDYGSDCYFIVLIYTNWSSIAAFVEKKGG